MPHFLRNTVPAHESTYSHPRPYCPATRPVLPNTSRRSFRFTAEIMMSSLRTLPFGVLVLLTMSRERLTLAIEIRDYTLNHAQGL
jgi:hypothetical protein